jgi:hypothetical protein
VCPSCPHPEHLKAAFDLGSDPATAGGLLAGLSAGGGVDGRGVITRSIGCVGAGGIRGGGVDERGGTT